ncbi:MAG: hypothetical protein AB7U62_14045 [Pseudolabrys sp.]
MMALSLALVIGLVLVAPAAAQTYDCRRYPPADVTASLKSQAEAMRKIEIETADRLGGLDTRPYDWLLEQARTAETAIAVPALLKAEDKLFERCRNAVRPVRRGCAAASAALVEVLDGLAAEGQARRVSRQVYLQTMPLCERWLGLKPLESALRTVE